MSFLLHLLIQACPGKDEPSGCHSSLGARWENVLRFDWILSLNHLGAGWSLILLCVPRTPEDGSLLERLLPGGVLNARGSSVSDGLVEWKWKLPSQPLIPGASRPPLVPGPSSPREPYIYTRPWSLEYTEPQSPTWIRKQPRRQNNWGWKCKPAQSVYGMALVFSICVELWKEIPFLIKQTTILLPLKTVDWDKGCMVSAAVWHGLAVTQSPEERLRVLAWSLGAKRETAKPRWCHHLRRTVLKTEGTVWKLRDSLIFSPQ